MIYPAKKVVLKNGLEGIFRSPEAKDAVPFIAYLKKRAMETDFVLSCPEEYDIAPSEEASYITTIDTSKKDCILLCEIDGEIAGQAYLIAEKHIKTAHRATVGIDILQKYWHMGIGSSLFTAIFKIARDARFTQLELKYVKENARAKGLYEKMGFTPIGEIPNARLLKDGTYQTEVYMVKQL